MSAWKNAIPSSRRESIMELEKLRQCLPGVIEALEQEVPYAHALFESRHGMQIRVTSKERFVSHLPPVRGLVLTASGSDGLHEVAVDRVSAADLDWALQKLARTEDRSKARDSRVDPGPPLSADFIQRPWIDPREVSLQEKVDRCAELEARLREADRRVVSASAHYSEHWVEKLFVNRTRRLFQRFLRLSFAGHAVVSDGRSSRVARVGNAWSAGFEKARVDDRAIDESVQIALRLLDAPRLEPGVYTIVGGPNLSGVIAHEAFGHGVEADLFLKNRAEAARYLGKRVASEVVDMYDSPAYPGLTGSYFFDDEGALATETPIIERGVLRNVLTDLHAATHIPTRRSANGRRESWAHKAYARMSNTYFGPGESSLEELISGVDQGLYIRDSLDGMEDPKGWGIQVEGAWVREIRAGRLTDRYYQPVVLTGYVPELLQSIDAVADDLRFEGLGLCQKGHKERVWVSVGGPHMRFRGRVG